MVDKIRVVKKIEISAEKIKKVRAQKRLTVFWQIIFENFKGKKFKINVSKIRVGSDLAKLLNKNPWAWFDVGPCINKNIPQKKDVFIVEICAGWNLIRRKTAEERVKEMLTGQT